VRECCEELFLTFSYNFNNMGDTSNHEGREESSFMLQAMQQQFAHMDVVMQTKELDMLIIHVRMELKLHKTLCHFLVAQLQDLEPNVSRKH
jgi:hypothetical protein